jgi:hypothetical protein
MVRLQDSILECLHYHTFSNMFFDRISKAYCAWILSCSSLRVGIKLIVKPIFSTFRLFSPIFFIAHQTWLGLPHPSIANIPQCVCTHPINPMSIHFLHYAHGNKCIWTHDAICDTFTTIAWDVGFHMGWEQLHVLPSTTFNSICW